MKPSSITRRAQALINYKLAGGETVSPDWLVSTLEKMAGVTEHHADQAAAKALASPETAKAIERAQQLEHYRNHPAALAAALRAEAEKHERGEAL